MLAVARCAQGIDRLRGCPRSLGPEKIIEWEGISPGAPGALHPCPRGSPDLTCLRPWAQEKLKKNLAKERTNPGPRPRSVQSSYFAGHHPRSFARKGQVVGPKPLGWSLWMPRSAPNKGGRPRALPRGGPGRGTHAAPGLCSSQGSSQTALMQVMPCLPPTCLC